MVDWASFYARDRRGISHGRPRAVKTFLERAPVFARTHYVRLFGRQWQLRRAGCDECTGLSDRPDVAYGQLLAWLAKHGVEPGAWLAEKAPELVDAATWWTMGGDCD